jgi:TorA maturation chaperone TorD
MNAICPVERGSGSHAREGRARLATERAAAYARLAAAFDRPSEALAEVTAAWSGPGAGPGRDWAALALEHTRLFVGPGRVPAPPYGSVYHEGHVLMGESTLDAMRQYREAGFSFAPDAGMLADHVVAELSFLAVLADEEAQAWTAGDEAGAWVWLGRRGAFLCDHLGAWAPLLCQRILSATDEPFYRAVAVSLRELVAVDLDHLATAVEGRPAG